VCPATDLDLECDQQTYQPSAQAGAYTKVLAYLIGSINDLISVYIFRYDRVCLIESDEWFARYVNGPLPQITAASKLGGGDIVVLVCGSGDNSILFRVSIRSIVVVACFFQPGPATTRGSQTPNQSGH
jgi:hypothetical protein